jgi:tripartite-type tricarboxylate transporter receptor subunit TctC
MSDVKDRLAGLGAQAVGGTPEEFLRFQVSEMKRWDKIIKAAGIQLEQ